MAKILGRQKHIQTVEVQRVYFRPRSRKGFKKKPLGTTPTAAEMGSVRMQVKEMRLPRPHFGALQPTKLQLQPAHLARYGKGIEDSIIHVPETVTIDLWDQKNRRRVELIRRKNREGLSAAEKAELSLLQKLAAERISAAEKLPFKELEELRAALKKIGSDADRQERVKA